MKKIEVLMPERRKDELVVRELPDEVLVYDLERHKAHCLNQTSALVWKHCDGTQTVPDVARLLERELRTPVDEAVVWLALDQLGKFHLLQERIERPAGMARISRRELVRTYLPAALTLPLIVSLATSAAAGHGSCGHDSDPCVSDSDCCSNNCEGGFCAGG